MSTYSEVRDAVIEVLTEIQVINGQPLIEISDDTCPAIDLAGFESVHCVEGSVLLSNKLGCDFDPGLMLPGSPTEPPLSVKAIVDRAVQDLLKQERKSHGRN